MCVMPFIAINSLITLVTFIMACMISVGFKQFCGHIEDQFSGFRYVYFEVYEIYSTQNMHAKRRSDEHYIDSCI